MTTTNKRQREEGDGESNFFGMKWSSLFSLVRYYFVIHKYNNNISGCQQDSEMEGENLHKHLFGVFHFWYYFSLNFHILFGVVFVFHGIV